MTLPRGWLAVSIVFCAVSSVEAQNADTEAYFRAIGGYFEVQAEEILILSEWDLSADEIPVVLFVARRASIPPDAVVALRRRGSSWQAISRRYGWGAEVFHIALADGEEGELLATAFREYRSRPRSDWRGIELSDAEVVALVNVRALSAHLGVPPASVVRARSTSADFPAALRLLVSGR